MPHPTTIRSGTYLTSLALVLCMLFVACGHDSLLDEEIADAGGTEDTGIFAWLMLPPKPVDDCRGLGKWLDKYGNASIPALKDRASCSGELSPGRLHGLHGGARICLC